MLWAIGVSLAAAFIFLTNRRFSKKVKKEPAITDERILTVFEECKKKMGVTTLIPSFDTYQVTSPTLFGFIKPKLLIPKKMMEEFTTNELRYIFLHELAHFKRKDIGINRLMSCLLIFHWFNLLLWYAYRRMRENQEIACDALLFSGQLFYR